MTITLPGLQRSQPGFIDPNHPNAINHLIVGDLADEEILLIACDNGDVMAYWTRSIQERVTTRLDQANIPYFFATNVGASAWGLAVHSLARLIAVSSNAHEIVVYAPGLSRDHGSESSHSEDESE